MSDKEPNYFWEAFKTKWSMLGLLGGTFAALFVKGIPTLAGLGVVAVAELVYIIGLAANGRFRRIVKARHAQNRFRDIRRRMEGDLFRMNKNPYRERYTKLRKNIGEIWRHYQRTGQKSDQLAGFRANLDKMQNQFLELVFSLRLLDRYESEANGFAGKIAELKKEMEESTSASVKDVKRQRLELLEKRQLRIDKAKEHKEVVANQIEMINETINYLLDKIVTIKEPEDITREVERIVVEADNTAQVIDLSGLLEMEHYGEADILEATQKIREM